MKHIGFTGTREGMTQIQYQTVKRLVQTQGMSIFHLGDCLGADKEMLDIVRYYGRRAIGHPPDNPKLRYFGVYDFAHPPRPYLLRNRDIVDASESLIAAPATLTERYRGSGTWSTIRYARAQGIPVTIVYRNGTIV